MSAFDFSPEQLESLRAAMKERLDSMPLHPHQRLEFPPMCEGKDVVSQWHSAEATLSNYKIGKN